MGDFPVFSSPDFNFTLGSQAPTPEPTTVALAGLGGLAWLVFRRQKTSVMV